MDANKVPEEDFSNLARYMYEGFPGNRRTIKGCITKKNGPKKAKTSDRTYLNCDIRDKHSNILRLTAFNQDANKFDKDLKINKWYIIENVKIQKTTYKGRDDQNLPFDFEGILGEKSKAAAVAVEKRSFDYLSLEEVIENKSTGDLVDLNVFCYSSDRSNRLLVTDTKGRFSYLKLGGQLKGKSEKYVEMFLQIHHATLDKRKEYTVISCGNGTNIKTANIKSKEATAARRWFQWQDVPSLKKEHKKFCKKKITTLGKFMKQFEVAGQTFPIFGNIEATITNVQYKEPNKVTVFGCTDEVCRGGLELVDKNMYKCSSCSVLIKGNKGKWKYKLRVEIKDKNKDKWMFMDMSDDLVEDLLDMSALEFKELPDDEKMRKLKGLKDQDFLFEIKMDKFKNLEIIEASAVELVASGSKTASFSSAASTSFANGTSSRSATVGSSATNGGSAVVKSTATSSQASLKSNANGKSLATKKSSTSVSSATEKCHPASSTSTLSSVAGKSTATSSRTRSTSSSSVSSHENSQKVKKRESCETLPGNSNKRVKTKKTDNKNNVEDGGATRKTKPIDNSGEYTSMKSLFSIEDGIGLLHGYTAQGTAFRVGSKYIMTAYHIFERAIAKKWQRIFSLLKDYSPSVPSHLSDQWSTIAQDLKVTGTNDPEVICNTMLSEGLWFNGFRSFKDLLATSKKLIGLADTNKLEKEVERSFQENCYVILGYTELQAGKKFQISCNIPFGSKDLDVLILELVDIETKQSPNYSCRFMLNSSESISSVTGYLNVLSHPGGSTLKSDLYCHLQTEKDANYLKRHKLKKWKKVCPRLSNAEINGGYSGCKSNEKQVLFNVSKSTTHGASGAPCIFERDKIQVVYAMLTKGYPNFFFNNLSPKEQNSDIVDPKLLVEACLPMSMVSTVMKEKGLAALHRDIYSQEVDGRILGYKKS